MTVFVWSRSRDRVGLGWERLQEACVASSVASAFSGREKRTTYGEVRNVGGGGVEATRQSLGAAPWKGTTTIPAVLHAAGGIVSVYGISVAVTIYFISHIL